MSEVIHNMIVHIQRKERVIRFENLTVDARDIIMKKIANVPGTESSNRDNISMKGPPDEAVKNVGTPPRSN